MPLYRSVTLLMVFISTLLTSAGYGYISPESVTFDPPRNRYLVSDQGNGRIYQIDSTGKSTLFSSVLPVTKGLFARNDTLFASGSTRGLFAFDLNTAEILFEVDFPGQVDLNDVAADTSGNIFVSDAQGNQIFKVHLPDMTTALVVPYVTMANGLLHDPISNRMLYCQWIENSPISAIDLSDNSVSVVADHGIDLLDGLTEDNAGNIYVSCFGTDVVYRYDHDFSGPPEVASTGHNNPGDIFYNKRDEILAVPNVSGGNVQFVSLPVGPVARNIVISDDNYGNGDGIPDAGETVELYFSLINTRPDSIFELTVGFLVDDASIIIHDGQTDIGAMAFGDTLGIFSDPFVFEIPAEYIPRIGTLSLEMDYRFRGAGVIDTVSFDWMIGRPRILLVDDDNGDNLEQYYYQSLENLKIPYRILDLDTAVTGDILPDYETVIWFVGDYRISPLDETYLPAIQAYLDLGGKMFLTGQGIAAQLYIEGNNDFLNHYLRCSYSTTSLIPVLGASPGGAVFDLSDSVYIDGNGGAYNQVDPDHIMPVNDGVGEFNYIATSDYGAVSHDGAYKLVFFGFGFEGIVSGLSRWTDRDEIMEKVLLFLGYSFPVNPITVSITPGDPMRLIDHTPQISWDYGAAANNQQMYTVQVGSDDDWTMAEMWDTGPLEGPVTSVEYAGEPLLDGQSYYLRIRVSDGGLWSSWYYAALRLNSAPTTPVGLTPDGMAEVATFPVILSHNNAVDNEGDEVGYDYEVYDDALLTELVYAVSGQSENPGGVTSLTVPDEALAAGDYYWRARASEDLEAGEWSGAASFDLKTYMCGDANGDWQVNVGDAVTLINFVFKGGASPDPLCGGDANGDGETNVGDAVYLINYVFRSGPAPAANCCY